MGKIHGQVSLEFVMMLFVIFIITIFLSLVTYRYIADYSEQRNFNSLDELGKSLQSEVVLAHAVEPGYSRTIIVPSTLDNNPVNISGTQNDIVLTYKGTDLLFRIPRVNGAFSTGANTIRKSSDGSVSIS